MALNKNKTYDRVAYYYDSEVGNFHYGPGHPMKPFRIHLTHDLVINYNLYRSMSIYRPRLLTAKEMTTFHSEEYISFLSSINPDNYFQQKYKFQLEQFTLGPKSDCPIFDGMFANGDSNHNIGFVVILIPSFHSKSHFHFESIL